MINVPGTAVELHPADLPMTWAARLHELRRLSRIVHVPVNEMLRGIKARGNDPVTPVVVREDVKRTAPINYLYEHADEFPGVSVTNTYLRYYPHGDLAAQVLGLRERDLGPRSSSALQRKGYAAGDKIGEAGVEASYDSYLRGRAGLAQLRVDSLGRPRSPLVTKRQPARGRVDQADDRRRSSSARPSRRSCYGINQAFVNKHWQANGGAIVALDPRDGSIRAMASYPTYNPSIYTGHVTTKRLAAHGLTPSTAEQRQLPVARPRLERRLSGRLDVQAGDRARRARDGHAVSPSTPLQCTGSLHGLKRVRRRALRRSSTTSTRTSTSR